MILVILSGVFGVYAYVRYPRELTENQRGSTLDDMFQQIFDLDQECRDIALKLSDEINAAVTDSIDKTHIGGSMKRQLSGYDPSCATAAALNRVKGMAGNVGAADVKIVNQLVSRLTRKSELLDRARRDVRFRAMMRIWLYIHVPITFALIAALITHIISVFFYW